MVQQEVMVLKHESLEDFLNLQKYSRHSFNPNTVTPAQAVAREPDVRRALSHLEAMYKISSGLLKNYDDLLRKT